MVMLKQIRKFCHVFVGKHRFKLCVLSIILIAYIFCLPRKLFDAPTSTVLNSREGTLLGAQIAADGQWRFPAGDNLPRRFKECVVHFEDAYFYHHPGFNPVSIIKALRTNIVSATTKRGGSTLTQQVIRMSRGNPSRTYWEKGYEIVLATRLELRECKDYILRLWSSNAPFGGNVVGLEAAAWRYFKRPPEELSWAESATLAVLPNAPSLIYPGRNQEKLLHKRNRLLRKLFDNHVIDTLTYDLALSETLPGKPYALPQRAPHLLDRVSKSNAGKLYQSSIQLELQKQVNAISKAHYNVLSKNEIYNNAVLVLDVKTREVLAYVETVPPALKIIKM